MSSLKTRTSSGFSSLKKGLRMGKQMTLQKMGKAAKVAEDPEFRASVDHCNAVKGAYKSISTNARGFVAAANSSKIASTSLAESYRQLVKTREDTPLAEMLGRLAAMHDQVETFRGDFTSKAETETLGPITDFEKETITTLEKLKKDYNAHRLAHDGTKQSLDSAIAKGSAKPEKVSELQREYGELHERYVEMQTQYMKQAAYIEMVIQKQLGLHLVKMYRHLHTFHGQAYRLLSDLQPSLDAAERRLLDLPEPVRDTPPDDRE